MKRPLLVALVLALAVVAGAQTGPFSYSVTGSAITSGSPTNVGTATYGQIGFSALPTEGEWFQFTDSTAGVKRFHFTATLTNNWDVLIADTLANQMLYLVRALQCDESGKETQYKCTGVGTILYSVSYNNSPYYIRLTPRAGGTAANQTFTADASNDDEFAISQSPSGGTDATPCAAGAMKYNSSYLYVCTSTDTWKRATLGSF